MKQAALASGFHRGRSRAIPVAAAVMTCLAVSWAGVAGPAAAAPSKWESYHFEYGGADGFNEDFCGVPGLTVQQEGAVDGRFRTTTHGPDGLSYYYDHATYTDTWTNVETGESVTDVGSYRGGSLRVTDNGDGTLTVIVQNTGHSSMYNEDGERIYHSGGGVFRFELLFDHAGTPTNPDDDEFLAFVGVLKHTGRDDGFCETLVEELG